jgi:ATP-binding cassette subfamily B (MDR/TAP) protein 1
VIVSYTNTSCSVVLSVLLASSSIGLLYPQVPALSNGAAAASEMFKIFDKPSLMDPLSSEGKIPESCHGHLEVENVSFSYPSRPDAKVLNNMTLNIPAGKTTAFVGASGSGKSTIIGLLERWYVPASGRFLLDGVDVSMINVKWLRSQMALVQQASRSFLSRLLKLTLSRNLYCSEAPSLRMLQRASRKLRRL